MNSEADIIKSRNSRSGRGFMTWSLSNFRGVDDELTYKKNDNPLFAKGKSRLRLKRFYQGFQPDLKKVENLMVGYENVLICFCLASP